MSKCYDNPEYDDTYSDIQNTWNQHPKVEQEHETKVMKNIHILPTDNKPSRLYFNINDREFQICEIEKPSTILKPNRQIYITNLEEIKEGDWCYNSINNNFYKKQINKLSFAYEYKIILTTDQDLIKDGVQAIDDEFLEWFVKNPSCEEVKILRCPIEGTYTLDTPEEELKKNFYCGDEVDYDDKCLEQCDRCVDATGVDYGYLPKEQPKYPIGGYAPGNYMCNCSTCKTQFQGDKRAVQCEPCAIKMIQKQNVIDMMKGDEELGLYKETFEDYLQRLKDRRTEDDYKYTDEDFKNHIYYILDCYEKDLSVYKCLEFMYFAEKEILPEQIWNKEKKKGIKQLIQDHKKETLEEAAERLFPNKMEEYDIFLIGAKWQQERSYSKEDLKEAWLNGMESDNGFFGSFEEWFEQFKNK